MTGRSMAEIRVSLDQQDGIASLVMDAPPVNALSGALRSALTDQLTKAIADPGVRAIILRAEGRLFSAGADIREFGLPLHGPHLSDLCNQIEAAPKPVIAALQGAALGGGAEIALAAHYRLAVPAATLGLPEVTLGLIPGAGGTQRLPRLVGAGPALAMMLDGRPVSAAAADAMGLIDGVVHADLPNAALAFAQGLLSRGLGPRPTCARRDHIADGGGWMKAVEQARAAQVGSPLRAEHRVIDCVEAALLLPFAAGLAFERTAFADMLADPQSRALRHLFLAERGVSPDLMARDAEGRRAVTPKGQAICRRLALARVDALEALVRDGADPDLIDRALVDQGMAAGPFGGRSGGAGPQGPPLARKINAAVMAEGCRLVADGVVRDTAAVDVLAIYGLGYPRLTGGPMQAAVADGLLGLRTDMARWAQDDAVWTVPALLDQAVLYADGFRAVPVAIPV